MGSNPTPYSNVRPNETCVRADVSLQFAEPRGRSSASRTADIAVDTELGWDWAPGEASRGYGLEARKQPVDRAGLYADTAHGAERRLPRAITVAASSVW